MIQGSGVPFRVSTFLLKTLPNLFHLIPLQAVLCSCFIPLWSGIIPPKFHGVSYMDGGLSNNLLVLDEQTVTISPFAGESDICPQDDFGAYMQLTIANTSIAVTPANMYRIQSILFPPHPEVMSKMCQQGFDDALRFLQRNNIISCLRCVAIQSSFSVTESEDCKALSDSGYEHEYDGCRDCEERRELAVLDPLPDPVAQAIQEAIDQVNNGLMNWLFKHKPVKILSFLTIPWVLPFDIAIVIIVKLHRQLPWIKNELKSSLHNLLSFARSIVLQMDGSKKHLYSAQFDCKLAVTEYDYKTEHLPASHVLGSGGSCSPLINPSSNPQQTVIPDSGLAASRKASLVKRSQTFGGRKKSALSREPSRMGSLRHQQLQRKSYAGSEFVLNMQNRRVSMMAEDGMSSCAPPERVITSMNLGLTLDLSGSKSGKSSSLASLSSSHSNLLVDTQDMAINESCVHEPPDVIETLKNLSEDLSTPEREISAISLANRALHLERVNSIDHLDHHDDGFERILAAAKDQEALMTYYYMDEKNQVKITQIFNLPTEQNAEVISCDELQSKW